jgi:hypothetical protein
LSSCCTIDPSFHQRLQNKHTLCTNQTRDACCYVLTFVLPVHINQTYTVKYNLTVIFTFYRVIAVTKCQVFITSAKLGSIVAIRTCWCPPMTCILVVCALITCILVLYAPISCILVLYTVTLNLLEKTKIRVYKNMKSLR